MWTVIYVAYNQTDSEKVEAMLEKEGFLVKVKQISKKEDGIYELLVPDSEVEEAHNILLYL